MGERGLPILILWKSLKKRKIYRITAGLIFSAIRAQLSRLRISKPQSMRFAHEGDPDSASGVAGR